MNVKTILVAVDFSRTAARAARYAAHLFAPDAELVLLHVIDPPRRPRFVHDKLPPADVLEGIAREHAEGRMLEYRLERAHRRSGAPAVRVGRPHRRSCENVGRGWREPGRDRPARRSSAPSKFLGTTADRIARTSPVPVLVATNPTEHAPRRILVPVDDDDIAPDGSGAMHSRSDSTPTSRCCTSGATPCTATSRRCPSDEPTEAEARTGDREGVRPTPRSAGSRKIARDGTSASQA